MSSKRILGGMVAALAAVGLAGCATTTRQSSPTRTLPPPPAAVAVVTGDANSPQAILTPGIQALLERAFARSAGLAVVDAGGRPRLWSATLGGDFANTDAKDAAEATQLSQVGQVLARVVPAVAQSDPWQAVSEAVGWLQGQGGGTLVVDNSGLGTTGFLDYRQAGLLEATPADLVGFARAHHELPDAQGIHVILLGVGWTAPPQPALDAPERANLTAQWVALLDAAGATVSVNQTPLTGPGPPHAPKVSLVTAGQVAWRPPAGTCGTALNSLQVHFVVGTATLTNPTAATALLSNLVATLIANHRAASFTGTTSSEGGPAINDPLSRLRAATIARLAESLGLPPTQIRSVVGLGSNFPGYIPDTSPGGVLLPGPAAEDRQVIITWPCAPGEQPTTTTP